ncbi:FMN-binding negative transcriptional regulator [Mycetocola miduiensis]|uniref:Negative transcriptional regulator, PaiB family n=1 Tax=Mycetocola miduiensis TaxID=995034 RepID=A0A1I4ZU76_9MICO|nr:FMN-binding negative transcriptional regulator [Mycetocola miduiensis]SFN53603.1 negative transcriptional regulator, PaiB family [Mycetocola miduiensis]
MRQNPSFVLGDIPEIRRLIEQNPWVTLVSETADGLVASHYAVVLDPDRDDLTILGHVGRPDEAIHELGSHELLVIVQGPHGYISPGWYDDNPAVPTWNFVVAHLRAVPEILGDEENYRVLGHLVEHFEKRMPEPRLMEGTPANAEYARRISSGTVGFRLTPTRVTAKRKLSQNRPAETVERIIDQLENGVEYPNPALAAEMRRARR